VADTFQNPLRIDLGAGRVQLQIVQTDSGHGILMQLGGPGASVGDRGGDLWSGEMQPGQVMIHVESLNAARIVRMLGDNLVARFEEEADEIPDPVISQLPHAMGLLESSSDTEV